MIRTQNMTPEVYSDYSRDYQALNRLYDFNFNSSLYNVSTLQYLTDPLKVKSTALPLVGDKYGIKGTEAASNRQLLDALPLAVQYKGSLKAVKILLHAFLDSLQIFSYAMAFHCKDEESTSALQELLQRPVQPYSVVIVLSQFPSMVNLQILDEYLRMVIPSGMIIDYAFGMAIEVYDKFKYQEYCFLMYVNGVNDGLHYVVENEPGVHKLDVTDPGDSKPFVSHFINYVDVDAVGIATVSTYE